MSTTPNCSVSYNREHVLQRKLFRGTGSTCRFCPHNYAESWEKEYYANIQSHFNARHRNTSPELCSDFYSTCGMVFETYRSALKHICHGHCFMCSGCNEYFESYWSFNRLFKSDHRKNGQHCSKATRVLVKVTPEIQSRLNAKRAAYSLRTKDASELQQDTNCNEDKECQVCKKIFFEVKKRLPINEKELPFTCYGCKTKPGKAEIKIKEEVDDPFANPAVQEILNNNLLEMKALRGEIDIKQEPLEVEEIVKESHYNQARSLKKQFKEDWYLCAHCDKLLLEGDKSVDDHMVDHTDHFRINPAWWYSRFSLEIPDLRNNEEFKHFIDNENQE